MKLSRRVDTARLKVAEPSTALVGRDVLAALPWERIAVAFAVAGVLLRALYLGDRPVHHDESIHATLSYQWWENPAKSAYRYDPTYHGPFLYVFLSRLFPLLGVGVAQARLFPFFFGSLVMVSPWLFLPWIGRAAAAVAVAALAVSPLFTYYSRFLAHDMPSVFFAVVAAAAFLRFRDSHAARPREASYWLACGAASLGMLYSVKAVAFLYCFVFLTYAVFSALFARADGRRSRWWSDLVELFRDRPAWAFSLGIFSVAYGIFQTSLFHFPAAFPEGIFTRVISHWWEQHAIERVKGPGIFHLRSLLLHELPVLVAAVAGVGLVLWRHPRGKQALAVLGLTFLATIPFPWKPVSGGTLVWVFSLLKAKDSADLFNYTLCAVLGLGGTWALEGQGKRIQGFFCYWAFASLAIYSYIGEKAPWLTVHVAFPMVMLAALRAIDGLGARGWLAGRSAVIAAVAIATVGAYQLRLNYLVTFLRAGEPTDLLSQVHNSRDVRFVMSWIHRVSMETGEKPVSIPIAFVGQPVWAFYFHLIEGGYKKFVLSEEQLDGSHRFAVVDEATHKRVREKMEKLGYTVTKLDHSGWWVPEDDRVGWGDWLSYAWSRQPSTATGITPMFVYHRAFVPGKIP